MRLRPLHFACLALVLLGLAGTVYKVHFPPGPMADEAAYALMAESLWHDRDLQFDRRDLERAYNLWDQGPQGIILFTRDGGETMFFGKPFVYSAVALPLVLLFGTQGFLVLNMALYLAMLAVAWLLFQRRREEVETAVLAVDGETGTVPVAADPAAADPAAGRLAAGAPAAVGPTAASARTRPAGPYLGHGAAGLFLGGFFFASASFVYVFWIHPEVFNMACVFLPLAAWAWLRGRARWGVGELLALVVAGGLLAAAFVSKEPLALMALPLGVDLVWSRRFKGLAAVVVGGLLGLALLVGIQYKLTGAASPYRGVQRSSFETNFPFEMQGDPWAAYKGTSYGSWSGLTPEATPRTVLYDAFYFFVGRHTGLLPYFPFAVFALGLYLWACFRGPRDRFAHLVALAVLAYCAFFVLMRPWNYQGGAGFLGNRYFAGIYPVLLLLVTRFDARKSLLLPFAAAGLWTAAVVAVPLQQITPEATLQSHVRTATFQALPLELTLLSGGSIPGYTLRNWGQGVWVLPKQNFFHAERHPNGIWVRGASRSEVVVISPVPLRTIYFTAYSPLPDNVLTVESGIARVAVPFSEEENRDGILVELPVEPVARDLGSSQGARREYFYRFTLSTTDGWMPARLDPESPDYRYLSVFLSFSGDPP